jgi:Cu2+-exporting ATPase
MHAHEAAIDEHGMMEEDIKKRFIVSLVLAIPALIFSPTIQSLLGFTAPQFPGSQLIPFIFSTGIVLYGGLFFYRGALQSLKTRYADMNVLVSIAVLSGYVYSLGATFVFPSQGVDFYWEVSTLVVFLLFGHWMEMRSLRGATGALRSLVALIPPTANHVMGKDIHAVPTAQLRPGDIVLVRPGEKVPVDGEVIDGTSSVNEAMITGESTPIRKKEGSKVIGGTLNIDGALKVEVTKTGEETALAQIIKLVRQAQESKPRAQTLATRAAHYLTIIAVGLGIITFLYWNYVAAASTVFAVTLAITVIVIACPHALGLAIPTVTSISTSMAAERGILIKDANGLEISKRINTVLYDKTGTLTSGKFGVTDIVTTADWLPKEILRTAAALEAGSEHFIAKGITEKAKQSKVAVPRLKDFKALPGRGVTGKIDKHNYYLGNTRLLQEVGIAPGDDVEKTYARLTAQGKTVIMLADEREVKGIMALADLVRNESKQAVTGLKALGLEVAMITGDNAQVANWVGKELGIDIVLSEVLPDQKANKVRELQEQGKVVAMVGDGINDAAALTQADVGIAIGAGTDVAIESADVVLVKNDPRDVVQLIRLSKLTMRKMTENLAWATGYNVIALPLAAGVLAGWGIFLRPEWGVIAMTASSIIVVSNALLMRRQLH